MTWWPGLVVLALALAAGFWWSRRGAAADSPPSPPPTPWHRGHPMAAGFVLGAVSTGLLAAGVVAVRGRTDLPGGEPHAAATPMSGAAAASIARLRRAAEANPADLASRRQLAVELLQANQLFDAFQEAQRILEAAPGDFDARMVLGVVRLAMGSLDEAASHFESAMAEQPGNPAGYLYRGLTYERAGDASSAVAVWTLGLEAAGGSHADLEDLIHRVESGGPALGGPPALAAPPAGDGFTVHVALGPGVGAPAGSVLFAALRTAPGTPPVAVKRLANPVFPLDLTLTQDDAMIGGTLPAAGVLSLRLDRDGDASTREPGEPAASLEVRQNVPAGAVLTSA